MKFSLSRALIIARREYLTTVRRKGFLFSVLLTPLLMYVSVMFMMAGSRDARKHAAEERIVALVDSAGVFASAPERFTYVSPGATGGRKATVRMPAEGTTIPIVARRFASQQAALDSLGAGTVNTVIVVPQAYLAQGHLRRYEHENRAMTETIDDSALRNWLVQGLLGANVDSVHIQRVVALQYPTALFVPNRSGSYELKDNQRELWTFILPFALALLLGMAISSGGQYLLQGVSEEKETRILESLLCTVSPTDLMVGKLIGLGGAGLTLVGVWLVGSAQVAAPTLAALHLDVPPYVIALGVAYFVFGYLFFASVMTSIGAITNNLREAQQLSVTMVLLNFIPFYALPSIMNAPNSKWTIGLSLFPVTAPTTMMIRLGVGSITGTPVPPLQVALSLGLLAVTAILTLLASAKIFRLGLLLYGKTPNLPEILRILRQR